MSVPMLILFCGNIKNQLTFRVLHHFKQKTKNLMKNTEKGLNKSRSI